MMRTRTIVNLFITIVAYTVFSLIAYSVYFGIGKIPGAIAGTICIIAAIDATKKIWL